jgi:uncharacterized OB-fold protein
VTPSDGATVDDTGAPVVRPVPTITPRNRAFWTGGASGSLLITRCADCGHWLHPPLPMCPRCQSTNIAAEPVSGRGTIFASTVSYRAWSPGLVPPYVVADVELVEQAGLLIRTNIVGCDVDDVVTGQRVEVVFEEVGSAYVPLFQPVATA